MPNEKPFKLNMPFAEALKRFVRTDPQEVAEAMEIDTEKMKKVNERIKKTREEIARGARSGKPRFRL